MKLRNRLLALLLAGCILSGGVMPVYAEMGTDLLLEQTFGTSDELAIAEQVVEELTIDTLSEETAPEKNPEEKEPGETDPEEKEPGETDPEEKEPGEKEPGETDPEEKEPGEKEPGETDPEEKNPEEMDPEVKEKTPWEITVEKFRSAVYGQKISLKAKSEAKLSYQSADETVAKVDEKGNVTITGVGSTTVTITAAEDEEYCETSVEIAIDADKAMRTIELPETTISTRLGSGVFSLGAAISGSDKLTYKSSNSEIVTVTQNGSAQGKKCGTAVITVTAPETKYYKKADATVTVTVYNGAKVLNYSNSYKKSGYYKALTALKLTGNTAKDIVSIALSQLGYHEGRNSSQLGGNGSGSGNYTEYGRYFGSGWNPNPWCAMFVSWCAREAGVSTKVIPKYSACASYKRYYCKKGQKFYTWAKVRKKKYVPKMGDIILYANVKGGTAHHIGYVISAKYTSKKVVITTVEGNTTDEVRTKTLTLSRSGSGKADGQYVLGIAHPKY